MITAIIINTTAIIKVYAVFASMRVLIRGVMSVI